MTPLYGKGSSVLKAAEPLQFHIRHSVSRCSWYSFDWHWKDKRPSQPWSQRVILSPGPLDWVSIALTNIMLTLPVPIQDAEKKLT